jgi:hypothetical protein
VGGEGVSNRFQLWDLVKHRASGERAIIVEVGYSVLEHETDCPALNDHALFVSCTCNKAFDGYYRVHARLGNPNPDNWYAERLFVIVEDDQ